MALSTERVCEYRKRFDTVVKRLSTFKFQTKNNIDVVDMTTTPPYITHAGG